jgi:D-alanyl-D-alanine carboxypeptidase
MTGLIVLENYDLDDVVTIQSINGPGQTMDLEIGERITVKNLLYGLLVQSGNDAAAALAQFHPQGEKAFIAAMNQKAKDLHLNHTQFTNAAGLDTYGHYTTVHDLSLLAAEAMKNRTFKKMVSTQGVTVADVDNTIVHQLEAINQLLGEVPGLTGIKTGWTELAGECLVTYTQRNGQAIITVVLGSQDRFGESQALIDWAFANHSWEEVPPAIRS